MNSKISFFNKSVIRSDFKRFWWAAVLDCLAIFFLFSFIYINEVFDLNVTAAEVYLESRFYAIGNTPFPLVCIVPVGLAVMIFSYLNSSGSVSCLHGLPVGRRTFFASHILSGMIMLLIPVLVNVIFLLCFRINPLIAGSYHISWLFIWAGTYILYSLLAFAGTSCVCMIAGNSIAALLFTYIFAALPMAAESFINFFCSQQLYGYVENSNMAVTEFLYVTPRALIDNPLNVLKYIIFAIVLLMAAYFLYKGRKLENNGEVVAFSKLRPIFIYGVALCAGSVGYLYFNSIWDIHNILLLIPFGMIGIVIAEMIVKKSLKVRTVYKPVIIFCAAICVIQLCFQADLLGYERRIPAIDSIESAEFSPGVNMLRYDYSYNGKKVFYQEEDKGLRSVEDIDKVVRLHEELLKNRTGDEEYKSDDLTGVITYNLKNGRKITRAYEMNYNAHKEWLKPIVETLQIRKNYFPILKDNSKSIESIVVNDRRRSDSLQFYKNDKEVMDKIVEALRADVSNVIYDDFVSREEEFTEIEISYTRPAKYSDGSQVAEKFLPIIYERYYVRSSYKNTIAVLNELGFYKGIPSAEDIEAIGIILSDYESDTKSTIDVSVNNNENYSKYITDRADIAEIYDNCSRDMPKLGGSLVEFIVKGGRSFVINYDQNAEGIPDIMK